jgi:hypothetical protein
MLPSSPIAEWLAPLIDWPQSLAERIGAVPGWVLLLLVFVPSLAALGMRLWHLVPAIVMLNALIAVAALAWPAGELRTLTIGASSALILGLAGIGLRERRSDEALRRIQTQLAKSDERVGRFLEAVDRRTQIVDEQAVELAKIKLRNEVIAARLSAAQGEAQRPPNS